MTPLPSYVTGAWITPQDEGRPLFDAVTGEEVARVSTAGSRCCGRMPAWAARTAERHGVRRGCRRTAVQEWHVGRAAHSHPLRGVAVQINAFNFPVWGPLEKLAPAFLEGVPSVIKPASATA
ncbi:MAG: aldehyde dehydrogenase family protein [Micromonosporaceae bacterium]